MMKTTRLLCSYKPVFFSSSFRANTSFKACVEARHKFPVKKKKRNGKRIFFKFVDFIRVSQPISGFFIGDSGSRLLAVQGFLEVSKIQELPDSLQPHKQRERISRPPARRGTPSYLLSKFLANTRVLLDAFSPCCWGSMTPDGAMSIWPSGEKHRRRKND